VSAQKIDLAQLFKLLERLCLSIEGLREDLRPELKKTETTKRIKQEQEDLKEAAVLAVKKGRVRQSLD
jgi:transcriptional regulator of acetoin/glycerol metabolism